MIKIPSLKRSSTCHAKDPRTCRYHGTGGVSAESLLSSYTAEQQNIKEASPSSLAVNSSLEWSGKKPKWWKKYEKEAQTSNTPTTPVLVDVINSPAGQLAVVWEQTSQLGNDKMMIKRSGYGMNVCYYRSMKTGEILGYVKMAYMDENTFEQCFGNDEFTPYRYADRYEGARYGFDPDDDDEDNYYQNGYSTKPLVGEENEKQWKNIWYTAVRYSKISTSITDNEGRRVASYNISKDLAPDAATAKKELAPYTKKLKKDSAEKKAAFSQPYVDFSKVDESLSGKGFGSALYLYTARMLGKQNRILVGSTIQSPEAQKVWKGFKNRYPGNVKTRSFQWNGEEIQSPYLDFRS